MRILLAIIQSIVIFIAFIAGLATYGKEVDLALGCFLAIILLLLAQAIIEHELTKRRWPWVNHDKDREP